MNLKLILQKANACISAGDQEGFLNFCTSDTSWTFVGDRTLKGIDEVRAYMSEAYKVPPRFEVTLMIEEGNYLTAIGKISLMNEDSKWTEYQYCDVWRFENGKLAELKAFVVN
ncbi:MULTISPECIES: nuclear transport factor 2 family protein [Chryseobacterium]|jgi:ketosteroid isomerase-like protein|uniref:nuclear transport factor 2 family protein n=1 Tax=Chryseobacterium TaxID=59732 RepID=UPI0008329079|nr:MULTISPECIES: nuclear transport factor 2 family protein [Chryseobacterium]AZA58203.1 nuclear transport factor 2 family protein [Chryseobacterium shandongense]